MQQDTCTPEWCESPFHDHTADSDAMPALAGMVDPTDAAFEHISRVLLDMRMAGVHLAPATVTAAVKLGKLYHAGTVAPPTPPTPKDVLDQHVVYYMRFGHVIKIGTTRNLRSRTLVLRPDEILAAEPGGRDLEARRHNEFGRHRIGGERFVPGPDLLKHIATLRAEYGHPAQVANR